MSGAIGIGIALMKYTLPGDWDQLATKDDRKVVEEMLAEQTRTLIVAMAGFILPVWAMLAVLAIAIL